MEGFRSRSYGEGKRSDLQHYYSANQRSQSPTWYGINGMQDLRSYSTSYTEYPTRTQMVDDPKPVAGGNRAAKGSSRKNGSSSGWGLADPDLQRKKRVASYKAYTVEGKLKGSLRKSFRWIKDRCNKLANGW